MIYWQIFLACFVPNIVGYGGGLSSIPLMQKEVVGRYGWMTVQEFGEVLALGNALPGPINTKMAGYIGYEQGGVLGAFIGVFATVAPSLILMIALLSVLYRFKDSPKVKRMTLVIRPAIAILLGVMAYEFFRDTFIDAGWTHTLLLTGASFFLMVKKQVHPAFVICGSLIYGALFLGG